MSSNATARQVPVGLSEHRSRLQVKRASKHLSVNLSAKLSVKRSLS